MVYQNTTCLDATASDAVYDATNDLIYFIGKWSDGGSAKALIGEIDPNTGITNYIYNFYGDPNEIPNAPFNALNAPVLVEDIEPTP
jgi:hypothetical protein